METLKPFRAAKRLTEKVFGIRIMKKLPRGLDFVADMRKLPWPHEPHCIFDVGANIGQSAIPLAASFKAARVHCFEPSKNNYRNLTINVADNPRILPHHIGVSSTTGTQTLTLEERHEMHRIKSGGTEHGETETIQTTTLDDFCRNAGIDRISILKVDTEGHDMDVLKGSASLLSENRIDAICCEAGMSSTNNAHVPFREIHDFLVKQGYFLFGVYEQSEEWLEEKLYLRRADIAFISSRLVNK